MAALERYARRVQQSPADTARAEIARGRAALDESLARNLDATPDGRAAIALLLATLASVVFRLGNRSLATRLFAEAFCLAPLRLYLSSYTALRLAESRAFITLVAVLGLPATIVRIVATTLASLTRTGIAEMRHLTRTRNLGPSDWVGGLRALIESLLVVPLALFTFILAIIAAILHVTSKIAALPVAPLTPIFVLLLRTRSRRELAGEPDPARLRELAAALRVLTEKTQT
ncbi:MAG: hypothetical protein HYY84_17475 [Deltaproteobacteria bacterium]|nr:hypothetical protein [Deltaproteobacteria bacterium]